MYFPFVKPQASFLYPMFLRLFFAKTTVISALLSGCSYDMGEQVSLDPLPIDNSIELYDSIENYDLMIRRTGAIVMEKKGSRYRARFEGDASRLKRLNNTHETFTYLVDGNITSFEMTTFFHLDESETDDFQVKISNDGVNFSDVLVDRVASSTADNWEKVIYSSANIENADYIQFVFPKSKSDSNIWQPQVGSVRIQYLEDSSLALNNKLPLVDPKPVGGGSEPKVVPGAISSQTQFDYYITRKGNTLYDGNETFRFLSFNVPELHTQENPYWGIIDPFEQRDAIVTIASMGGKVARTYVLSVFNSDNPTRVPVHINIDSNNNLIFDETLFESMDNMLALANEHGVRVILPFIDNWSWWGGISDLTRLRGKNKEQFWTDAQLKQDYKNIVAYVLNRTNSITGIQYKDDPAILAWETGNELRGVPDEWTAEMSAYIKSIDSNHLVIDGKDIHISEASIVNTDIDIISNHYYGEEMLERYKLDMDIVAGRKSMMVGEFGLYEVDEIKSVIDEVIDSRSSGALIWSLRQHDANGGFLNHYEYGSYYAYHWPGFSSNYNYNEQSVVNYLWQKAAEITTDSPPFLASPLGAPRLLPINSISDIRWQGVVNAQHYLVERTETPQDMESWSILDDDVETGASVSAINVTRNLVDWQGVEHRDISTPVYFQDHTAELNKTYFYRVTGINETGSSEVSNVVEFSNVNGPDFGPFEDNMANYAYLNDYSDGFGFETGNEERFSGDTNRLKRYANTQEYIEYHFPSGINSIEIETYFWRGEIDVDEFDIQFSVDGENFEDATVTTINGGTLVDDWEKVTYQGKNFPLDYRYLRLQFPLSINDDNAFSPQLGKSRLGLGHVRLNFDVAVNNPDTESIIIDDYQSYGSTEALNNRYEQVDADEVSLTLVNNEGDKHLEMSYEFSQNGYIGIRLHYDAPLGLDGANGLSLDLTADQSHNVMVIQFQETNGEYWEASYLLSDDIKTNWVIAWENFSNPSWGGKGDGILDVSSIDEISVYINDGDNSLSSSGLILIDNIKTF